MKIYTKTGDTGTTSLVGGKRVAKSDLRLECYGTVDELNAHIGLLIAFAKEEFGENFPQRQTLNHLQQLLFTVGGNLACEDQSPHKEQLQVEHRAIEQVEQQIDQLSASLPQIQSFTLPQGAKTTCQSHVCRTVCRRAERRAVALQLQESIDPTIVELLNRISDYFYIYSRFIQNSLPEKEILWKKDCFLNK